ncbi:MAG: hypothetical protein MJ223_02360 [Mycoplasmoidaceae bacterium]|nr:hypothetical protein [Mycoplasmoidaceae bacterium]
MKNKFKIIFATSSALATVSPIVVLTGCSCNPEQQGDNTITVDEKNIELNDETIGTNLDPIATFDFSVADGIKVASKTDFNIEILNQKHTGGRFKDFGDDFQYHTKIDFNSLT